MRRIWIQVQTRLKESKILTNIEMNVLNLRSLFYKNTWEIDDNVKNSDH